MGSQARRSFDANCKDIDKLLQVHGELTGNKPGRRYEVEVLNKSGIVLLTSFWEAYCEDLAAEALELLVSDAPGAAILPVELQKRVARELKADKHELAIWRLADDQWRVTLQARLTQLQAERNRRLNTPSADNIDQLFRDAVGIEKVSAAWYWHNMSAGQARAKLDKLIELRGEVAHRGQAASGVRKTDVSNHYAHIKHLVAKTGGRVNRVVKKTTGRGIW
jgi:hypothetical protein